MYISPVGFLANCEKKILKKTSALIVIILSKMVRLFNVYKNKLFKL